MSYNDKEWQLWQTYIKTKTPVNKRGFLRSGRWEIRTPDICLVRAAPHENLFKNCVLFVPLLSGMGYGYLKSNAYSYFSLSKKKKVRKKVHKQKTPRMWGFEILIFPSNFLSISTCNFINVFVIKYYNVQFSFKAANHGFSNVYSISCTTWEIL